MPVSIIEQSLQVTAGDGSTTIDIKPPYDTGNGIVAGLLYPLTPTTLTPKMTLSLLNVTVTLVAVPTGSTCVHSGASVGRHIARLPSHHSEKEPYGNRLIVALNLDSDTSITRLG